MILKNTRKWLFLLSMLVSIMMLNGCAATGETLVTLLETPTVEASANRSAVAASELRLNNQIINHMPISADADWPVALGKDATDEDEKNVSRALAQDPWFATRVYSDLPQRKLLGGALSPGLSPLTYDAYKKVSVLYGANLDNWPNIFKYTSDFDRFLEFADADSKQPLPVEAKQAKLYPNIYNAIVGLLPVNFQKDLEVSHQEMLVAFAEVAGLKAEKSGLEQMLKQEAKDLDEDDKKQIDEQIAVLEVQIKEKETIADEKQDINFSLLDTAVERLKSDINLTPENWMLAKKIDAALGTVKSGALETGTLYTLSMATLIGRNPMAHFDKELLSLAGAMALVPASKRHLMRKRIERLKDNLIYLFPSIGMGSYYAVKQYRLASKYGDVTDVLISAGNEKYGKKATQSPQP